jgi:hypothetical protein
MTVIECGTSVVTKIGNKKGMITAVAIRFDSVTYEITYFDENAFQTVWLREQEMEIKKHETQEIGFKKC